MPFRVLISGSGIAGTVLAYWLLRIPTSTPIEITILERDPTPRPTGQSIDIRAAGVQIIRKMILEATIKQHTTNETGLSFVDTTGKVVATFSASGNPDEQSFTSEFEIFRGALASIFYHAVESRVETIFGDYIDTFTQLPTSSTSTPSSDALGGPQVEVHFANSNITRRFDLVIGCDGLGSKLRGLILGQKPRQSVVPLLTYGGGFTASKVDLLNGSTDAAWYNAPGGRGILLRPDPEGNTRVNFTTVCYDETDSANGRHLDALRAGADSYKKLLHETFADAGWIAGRVLEEMDGAEDFYCSEIAQVKADKIYDGRVTLVGDAGYCPSPLTGMGTTLAIAGAYVLAGEIGKAMMEIDGMGKEGGGDGEGVEIEAALERYQGIMIPYARSVQTIPWGLPQLVNPQTQWGCDTLRSIMGWITWLKLDKIATKFSGVAAFSTSGFKMPEYEWKE